MPSDTPGQQGGKPRRVGDDQVALHYHIRPFAGTGAQFAGGPGALERPQTCRLQFRAANPFLVRPNQLPPQPIPIDLLPAVGHFILGILLGCPLKGIPLLGLGRTVGVEIAAAHHRTNPYLKTQPLAGLPRRRHRLAFQSLGRDDAVLQRVGVKGGLLPQDGGVRLPVAVKDAFGTAPRQD